MTRLHIYTVVRKFHIDAGHRIFGHENKCSSLHGHSYSFEVYAKAEDLDNLGRVIDFGVLKEKIGNWLEEHWDHAMILWEGDPAGHQWIDELQAYPPFHDQKVYLLPFNPTAENLASFLLEKSNELLIETGIKVAKVVCWETPNCCAIAEL
jgi:6-pyruvoyltetrahydropterin/6-carboxytetrahydropterin synthase